MSDDTFAFILHPLDARRDASRKYPALAYLPVWLIEMLSVFAPALLLSEIKGVRSCQNHRELQGWFVACPLSARAMTRLPIALVYRKIIDSGKLAERLGAHIVGLGAFTSVVGDGGQSIAQGLNVPVTTGNSYTVATAIRAVRSAASGAGIKLDQTNVAVVGASGAIGSVCARLLAPDAGRLILVGRSMEGLQDVAHKAKASGAVDVEIGTDPGMIRKARIVITVTSATSPVIDSQHLGPGTIVCDVARPRDTALRVSQERPDVLVLEGGAVSVPGEVNFGFDFGFPPGMAYACMAETMALALEGRYESFTLGKQVRLDGVSIIDEIAARHGFKVAGLRSPQEVVVESGLSGVSEGITCAQAEELHRRRNTGTLPSLVKSVEVQSL